MSKVRSCFPEHPGPGRPHLRAEGPGGLCGARQVQAAEVVDNRFEDIPFILFSPWEILGFSLPRGRSARSLGPRWPGISGRGGGGARGRRSPGITRQK